MSTPPTLSIIIVTKNQGNVLKKSITAIISQKSKNHTPIEIIVVDRSTKSRLHPTHMALPTYMTIRHIHYYKRGISLARNVGIAAAKGKYICFIDDDVIVDAQWLQTLFTAIKKRPKDILFGQIIPAFDGMVNPRVVALIEDVTPWIFTSVRANNTKSIWPYTANVCIPREIFDSYGTFSEFFANEEGPVKHPYGEDPDFFTRVLKYGATAYFESNLLCTHHIGTNRASMRYLFWRYLDDGQNSILGFIKDTQKIHPIPIAIFLLRDILTVAKQNNWVNPYTYFYILSKFLGELLMCAYLVRYNAYYIQRLQMTRGNP